MAISVAGAPPIATKPDRRLKRSLAVAAGILAAVVGLGWAGLRVKPAALPAVAQPQPALESIPLPNGLPAPVERFYRQTYGERIPVIRSAVISGRGTVRLQNLFDLTFPIRFRFTHEAGRNYRHYIQMTFFGIPLTTVREYYVGGKERAEVFGSVGEGAKWDQGGNSGMWAESLMWMPAILLTDPRVRWEPVDDDTALRVVAFGETTERFVVRFDPANGKIQYSEIMRYKNGAGEKIPWINGMWLDEGRPWAAFDIEQIVFNVDVDTSLAARGP